MTTGTGSLLYSQFSQLLIKILYSALHQLQNKLSLLLNVLIKMQLTNQYNNLSMYI